MSTTICPECDMENPVSEDICIQCGFPLEAPAAATAVPVDENTCNSCGKAVSPDMKFCDGCGNPIGAPAPPPPIPAVIDVAVEEEDPTPPPPPVIQAEPEPPPAPAPQPAPKAAAAESQSWKLSVVEGFSIGKQYLLFREEMVIGRIDMESNLYPDIDLEDQDDGYVSRRHAIIRNQDGQVTVEDLGGDNGTIIQGRRIPPHKPFPMQEGQVLRVGKVGLVLKMHQNE